MYIHEYSSNYVVNGWLEYKYHKSHDFNSKVKETNISNLISKK